MRLGTTPPFRGPRGERVPGSIAEIHAARLGGVEQWTAIRGRDAGNPPLILLHGGPGFSETAMFRYHNAPLEDDFTVVYWDQRGAGKSWDPAAPRSALTVDRLVDDLDELVELVGRRLGRREVTIFGHSWGSVLGVLYAQRRPEKVTAYVGCGQIGDCADGEARSYAYALSRAQALRSRRALAALRRIGPPPYRDAGAVFTERTWLQILEGALAPREVWKLLRMALASRESSLLELPRTMRGFRATMDAMWPEVSRIDLRRLAPSLRMPVYFFLGRKDRFVPPESSLAYFEVLTAPSKHLVWFEESGHEPFVDEPARFNAAMRELVLPVAARSTPCQPVSPPPVTPSISRPGAGRG